MNITDVTPKTAAKPKRTNKESWVVLSIDTSDGHVLSYSFDTHDEAQGLWDRYDQSEDSYCPIRMFKITYREHE